MKKTLASIALAGLNVFSALASPLELNKALTGEKEVASAPYYNRGEGSNVFVRKKTPAKEGCSINVDACAYRDAHTNILNRSLGFEISDGTTWVYIEDSGADGLSNNDHFVLRHKFDNKKSLFLVLDYEAENNYQISGRIEDGTNSQYMSTIQTSNLNPLVRLLVQRKTEPLVRFGQQVYSDLVESVLNKKQPELPYQEIKTALREVESQLSSQNNPKKLDSGLIKLADKYLDMAKQRTRRQQNDK